MSKWPVAMVASVSSSGRRALRARLEEAGITTCAVDDAGEAAERARTEGSFVLVIDSGLLEALHDRQWRAFLTSHSGTGVVIRCLIPREAGRRRSDATTFLIHPDDVEGVAWAVRTLAAQQRAPIPTPWRAEVAS